MRGKPIEIVPYDSRWPEVFEEIRRRVATALGDVAIAIEHVGSTAVPGLAAKPVVDLDVVVRSVEDVPMAIARLQPLGYVREGDLGIPGREAFRAPPGTPSHHLYVCAQDSIALQRHLRLRDYLRTHPGAAAAYADLKRELAVRFRDDRDGYTEAKIEFIEAALQAFSD